MEAPSAFVLSAVARIARGSKPLRALDLAMGSGRNAVPLAERGFTVFGVDRDISRVAAARAYAASRGVTIAAWVADVSSTPLPESFFDLLVCVRFLDRAILPSLPRALKMGGLLVYETFTTAQLARDRGPRSPDHLLRPGELAAAFASLTTLLYDETHEPDALARLIARRESRTGDFRSGQSDRG